MINKTTNRRFSLAIVCLIFFVLVQLYQFSLRFILPTEQDPYQQLIQRGFTLNHIRYLLILLSIFGLVISYTVICVIHITRDKYFSIIALLFFMLFCFFEILYRSTEYFLVIKKWIPMIIMNPNSQIASDYMYRIQLFDASVSALYFPLLLCHLCGSLFLFLTIRKIYNGYNILLKIAMIINITRIIPRLFNYYLESSGLAQINNYLFFPTISLVFIFQVFYLLRIRKTL